MYTSYFLFNDTATTGIDTYGHTLSLPDALPICPGRSDLIPVINAAGIRLPAWRILGELGLRIRSALSAGVRALPSIKARRAVVAVRARASGAAGRSEEHTSELQSLMRRSYAVFCLKKKKYTTTLIAPR